MARMVPTGSKCLNRCPQDKFYRENEYRNKKYYKNKNDNINDNGNTNDNKNKWALNVHRKCTKLYAMG